MAVQFQGQVVGAEALGKFLTEGAEKKLGPAVERALGFAANAVKAKAQSNLSGPILNAISSHLKGSIQTKPFRKRGIDSEIHIGTPVIYGASHETGATITNGFGKGIAISLRARHWLRTSLRQVRDRVFAIYEREIVKVKLP